MKIKISILCTLLLILSLVACQTQKLKFGINLEKYEDIEYIYLTNPRVGKRYLDDELKDKIYKLIEKLNEDDFEKVEFETLKGEGPKIKFKDFTFEILDKKIRFFINIEDMKQYNPKKEIKELNELYTLLENELGLD
ncbi:hypothetical protein [Helcococcus sueciensis]|uniref:hypothetical protein n=1 Tax=Helcococcus sueciensis TaxID=241555 RepID=UPI000487FCC7|nr:hypothetical protein [Helcococcus sueciensis]